MRPWYNVINVNSALCNLKVTHEFKRRLQNRKDVIKECLKVSFEDDSLNDALSKTILSLIDYVTLLRL